MNTNWNYLNTVPPAELPKDLKNVLVTIKYDEELHIAYTIEGRWFIWIDDELDQRGDGWIENEICSDDFGVVAWTELPKRANWNETIE